MSAVEARSRIGDFELLGKLGEGGMGAVYMARQLSLDRIVALKVLPPKAAEDAEYLQRFFREARATAKLNHPNIVKGIAVGTFDGYSIFAMEYIEGTNLKKRILEKGPLPEDELLPLAADIASALAHVHAAGVIHRDVKPENILIDKDGTPKLSDLGLVSMAGDGSLTQSGYAVGTPHYMAPEQVRGEADLDGRADIYSFGCALYHAATGKTPYEAPTPGMLMVKHLGAKMPHPQSLVPALSDDLCRVLDCMVTRRREDRYAGMEEVLADFEALLEGQPPAREALPAGKSNFIPLNGDSSPAASAVHPTAKPVAGTARRRALPQTASGKRAPAMRWRLAGAALLAVLLLVTGLYFLLRTPKTDPGSATGPGPSQAPNPAQGPGSELPKEREFPVVDCSKGPVELFNGRDLRDWHVRDPRWELSSGELAGSGTNWGNACLEYQQLLPGDLELTFTAAWHGGFQLALCVDGQKTMDVVRVDHDEITLGTYDGNDETTLARAKLPPLAKPGHWRVVQAGPELRVFLDGALRLSSSKNTPARGGKRKLSFHVHQNSTLRLRTVAVSAK